MSQQCERPAKQKEVETSLRRIHFPPSLTFCPTTASKRNENPPSYTLWLFQIANAFPPTRRFFSTEPFESITHW